ncbi:MAG: hypothetical protein MK096_02755 [Oleiphilaceae bacterium]|nr:hypothetical protein [Oleiphilaceae bacterium]
MNLKIKHCLPICALMCASSISLAEESTNTSATAVDNSWTYIGSDIYVGSSDLSYEPSRSGSIYDQTEDGDIVGVRLKLGTKKSSGWRYQGSFFVEDFEAFDNVTKGLGFSLAKSFGEGEIKPFVRLGFSYGSVEIDDTPFINFADDTLYFFGIDAGVGGEYNFNQDTELVFGVDLGTRAWQSIDIIGLGTNTTLEPEDDPVTVYAGVNFKI